VILLLLALVLVPIAARVWAKWRLPQYSGTATGVGFGLVASPLSLGLYATYFLGPLGIVTGMAGLVLVTLHGTPGYNIAVWLGIVPSHTVVKGASSFYVEAVNGLFWAPIYGALGWVIDRVRRSRVAL